jgi:Na+/proline symporter
VILGLSYIDFAILVAFLVVILAIGLHAARGIKQASDFYLGGRKLGRTLQFFLNFGNATDTNAAPTMASSVYRGGASGIWLQLQTLLFTPMFWFTQPWFRRARLTTMADLFEDRYKSRACASAYAVFNVMVALLTLGLGNLGGYSVAEGMMVKDPNYYTVEEKAEVAGFSRLIELNKKTAPLTEAQGAELAGLRQKDAATLADADKARLAALQALEASALTPGEVAEKEQLVDLQSQGRLRGQIGAISKAQFYISYNLIVAIFIMLGGLKAAALTDAIQGVLILFMSLVLLPIGLYWVGGFSGLHAKIGDPTKFYLSGTQNSNFTWYSIAAFTFTSFIQIVGLQHNMSAAGSAVNENAARFGMLSGGFLKRIILICWMLCGFLGLALLSGTLDDPDRAWGALSKLLLPVGITGIMLSGMLLGHMPAVGLTAVAVSGLVVRNLYEPVVKGRNPKHYLRVGQGIIVLVLGASIAIAWNAVNLQALTTKMIVFNTLFGAVVLLLFFWRRLTVPAILISFCIWLVIQVIAPIAVGFSPMRHSKALTLMSNPVQIQVDKLATQADVDASLATRVNEVIKVPFKTKPVPLFFDKVVSNKNKSEEGSFFTAENYLMYHAFRPLGVDMANWTAPQIATARYLFDGFFPFLALIVISLVTRPSAPELAPPFYAKMKTPVAPTPELDHEEVEKSRLNPNRFDHEKLFPHSNWEFCKWTRQDYVGFFGCWALVFVILGILWLVLNIGKA